MSSVVVTGNASLADSTVAEELYVVGVAKVDITPDYPVRLSGFGFRREESDGVLAPIYARALAIGSDEQGPLILITVDSTGVSQQLVNDVAKELHTDGIAPERIAIAATHTHTAPMLTGVLPTLFGQPIPAAHQEHIRQYTSDLTAKLVQAAREALKDRKPSTLWWGAGELAISKNRRNPEGGPVDHGLPVLVVKSREGQPRAILSTYACHAVTLSHNLIGGDWPGFASDAIERQHPGVVAMISIGCGADQNPIPGVVGDKVEVAESQGLEYAAAVKQVLGNAMRPISGPLNAKVERFALPLADLPPREHWEERAKKGSYIGYHAEVQLETLDRGESLPTAVDYSTHT
ncbi:MAG: neutral/alkaline non-lysosomal ceramidase N-terminal domain-containing protein, partial [Planctomycetaceae bacterium]|nr:neutral/alkaline non-lysosomal ceramidase N-terminal domain-containing protein [Planctomycetaceae bacterium]